MHWAYFTGSKHEIVAFHLIFLLKFLRFTSMSRMIQSFGDLIEVKPMVPMPFRLINCRFQSMKLSYLKTAIILMFLRLILFIQLCVCGYKAVVSSVFNVSLCLAIILLNFWLKLFQNFCIKAQHKPRVTKSICQMLDPDIPFWEKYFLILEFACWAIFGTSFNSEIESFIQGKIIITVWIIIGVATSIYFLIQVLDLTLTIRAPRTKFYEVINQLDAYMLKKQLPLPLQKRLRFFYKKKFRNFFYREDEILGILSGDRQKSFHYLEETVFDKVDWWIF